MSKQRTTDHSAEPPSNDDASAFRAAVRDVKPLAHTPSPLRPERPKRQPLRAPPVEESLDAVMPLINPPVPGSELGGPAGGSPTSFRRAGVRTQVMRRLRRGLIPVEAEIDLHGLDQAAARHRLAEFLAHHRERGTRCVRIVHGKGYRSGARGPVLKVAVDHWLRRHLDVLAFTSARPIDGGTGAVYALLRG